MLIDATRRVPKYEKVLKDLCTKKQQLTGDKVISVWENVSNIIQTKLPHKCKDPGSFYIPVVIGNKKFGKSMLDLGTSFNVMPVYIYESLNFGTLKETRIGFELVDRTNVFPRATIKDAFVHVNHLVFLVNLCVSEIESWSDGFHISRFRPRIQYIFSSPYLRRSLPP